jgi:hypothetical protein
MDVMNARNACRRSVIATLPAKQEEARTAWARVR